MDPSNSRILALRIIDFHFTFKRVKTYPSFFSLFLSLFFLNIFLIFIILLFINFIIYIAILSLFFIIIVSRSIRRSRSGRRALKLNSSSLSISSIYLMIELLESLAKRR